MRLLKFAAVVLTLLVVVPVATVELFGDPIARRVVASLNERLQTEIHWQDARLSLLTSFPNLSADLTGVTVAGSDGSQLLEARRLACRLDLGSLFGKVSVSGILVEDGKLQLITDRDGNTNYQLLGYTSVGDGADAGAEKTSDGVTFAADRAQLRRVSVVYQDARLQTDGQLHVRTATLSGDFGSAAFVLQTEADLHVDYLDHDGTRYLSRRDLALGGTTTIDRATGGGYTLSPLTITTGELEVGIDGRLDPTDDGYRYDLSVGSRSGRLEDLLALLPRGLLPSLADLETRGDLLLAVTVNGEWTDRSYPRIDGRLTLSDGRLESPRMNLGARDLDLTATFAYLDGPGGGIQTFSIDRLTGNFGGQPLDLQLRVADLDDPKIAFRAEGTLPLGALPAFLADGWVDGGEGQLHLEGVNLSGRYRDMIAPRRMGRVVAGGNIRVEEGALTLGKHSVRFPSGTLVLDDNAFVLSDLAVALDYTELTLSGRATNLIPVLFADSLNSQDAALDFTAELHAERFDPAELLALTDAGADDLSGNEDTAAAADSLLRRGIDRRARVTDLLGGRFAASVGEWRWGELHGTDFRGELEFSPGQVDIRGMTDAMAGHFRVDATTFFAYTNRTEARITAAGVDARAFFAQSENFGQEVLTADNLSGTLNARMLIHLPYDTLGAVDYAQLRVSAGLEILDGELYDFALLENFAYALKAGDLERVRFTRLANYFEIRDRTVYLPAMFVQSSAVNLTLSGQHGFDQVIDYSVKVNAGQVVANKISRHDERLEVLPARNGLFNLYYTVRGPLETFTVATDKRAVKTDFRRSEYRRDRIRALLTERFAEPIELWTTDSAGEDL